MTKHDVFRRGEGVRYEARGSEMFFKATASTTQGRLSVMERILPPGVRMPPAHVHVANDEAYFVLDGQVTFIVDDRESTEEPETFLLIPGGTPHTFGNRTDAPARVLVMHTPALDPYFAELDRLWRDRLPDAAEERALMARHGMRPA